MVFNLNAFLAFLISFSISFSFFYHSIYFVLIQGAGGSNGNLLFLASAQILSAYVNDTVSIDVEGNLNLRYSTGSSGDTAQLKAAQGLVVSSHFAFALQNMDINGGLVICCSGEYLLLRSRNGGVAVDNLGEDTAQSFNTQGQRSYVQQQHGASAFFARKYASLNSSTYSNAFVRVNAFIGLLAHEFLNSSLYSGDTRRTAYQYNLGDIAVGKASVAHSLANRAHGAFYQISSHSFEFSTSQVHIQMFRAISTCSDEGQVDIGAHYAGQLNFSFFGSFTQTLHSHAVGGEVNAFGLLKFFNHPVNNLLIEVIAAHMGITIGCFYFEYTIAYIQNGYIEGAAAQVIYHDGVVVGLVNAISQGCSSRLVDNTQYFQTGNFACVLSCLTLAIVEVCRNGNYCLGYLFTQISFSVSLQLLQNHCGNFFRRVFFIIDGYTIAALAHMTFNGADGSIRVRNCLAFCQLANQTLTIFSKANYGRGQTGTLLVSNNGGFAAFHYSNNRVSST